MSSVIICFEDEEGGTIRVAHSYEGEFDPTSNAHKKARILLAAMEQVEAGNVPEQPALVAPTKAPLRLVHPDGGFLQ